MSGVALALLAAMVAAPSLPEDDGVRRYAVVIGTNDPARPNQTRLRYADDDAVEFYTLFRSLTDEAVLFALLDDETQRIHPDVVARAEIPEKARILSGISKLFARMRADRGLGLHPELYFIYSGHGFVDEHGEGHLALQGSTLSRSELYEHVISRSPASANHIIIDACDAYFVVQSRGDDLDAILARRAREFLDRQSLSQYPSTGAILSTASAAESHEWSEIQGGVFSHSVRSALVGGADVNGDGRVSYPEVEAFVLAATARVEHVKANRSVFVSPPASDWSRPVVDLAKGLGSARLRVDSSVEGRLAVSDERGLRYADLNKAPGYSVTLALVPGRAYSVRLGDEERLVPPDEREVAFLDLEPQPPSQLARGGGVAAAYEKGLFSLPFGPQLVDGFALGASSRHPTLVVAPPAEEEGAGPLRTAGWITAGAAVVAGGVATGAYLAGSAAHDDYVAAGTSAEIERLDARVRRWDSVTNVAVGAAVSLAVTSGVLWLIELAD